jgi:nucleoid-associated protein YgaU
VAIIATSQTVVPKRQTRSTPKRPEDAFTKVASGETLVDIVRRVYGPDASLEAVWKANRDQLPTPEASVRAGMILRTPELP